MCIRDRDSSGSMATSVVYGSIFASVMASIPALATKLVLFLSLIHISEPTRPY